MTQLPDVQVVGCFHYSAPECEGVNYRSLLVTRREDGHKTLADFYGRCAVYNAADSQSGYNALLKMVAPLAKNGAFFARTMVSGSHHQSLAQIDRGKADIAAIDCVSWALMQRYEPQRCNGLSVIDASAGVPGLPLITSADTSGQMLQCLREVLHELVTSPRYRKICAALLITGFSEVMRQSYTVLTDWRRQAQEQGITRL